MDTLFSADSALMRGLTRLADVMILNLLFIVTSLPVVTLGASLTALNFTAMRIGTGECVSVTGDYFRSFRQNFRQATRDRPGAGAARGCARRLVRRRHQPAVGRCRRVRAAGDLVRARLHLRDDGALRVSLPRQFRGPHARGAPQRAAAVAGGTC